MESTLKKRKVEQVIPSKKGVITSYFKKLNSEEKTIEQAKPIVPKRVAHSDHLTIIKDGNLFKSQMQTLVNTVNCEGVMGKGIAKTFKDRYPDMFEDYKRRCERGEVEPGKPYLFVTQAGVRIINFPTKNKWKQNSEKKWITSGLNELVANAAEWEITSLAIPALGCGNGGLNWNEILGFMCEDLSKLKVPVEIYAP